jgi:cellulose synthase/poly-beta-1,6-N-acetylglucosamine synthase-like glycosyltransferase
MLETFATVIFGISAAALIYVYIGYPLLVYLASLIRPRPVSRGEIEPAVTVLITAYNEENAIREKILNTLAIDYPPSKIEILVASDGSTDRTDEIVREFESSGVRLFRQEGRVGKTATQNNAVAIATGEIILFSDATTEYRADVLRRILPSFADDSVGCVAGKLVYVDKSASNVGRGAQKYWNYETFLKQSESRACSLIGASGCLYAVRRSAYRAMYPEACSDFLICTVLYQQGLRSVYEPDAICTEDTNRQTGKEMKMRVRVISQTFTDLWRNRGMMNPFRSGFYAVELISHKLLRYAVPLFLFMLFAMSGFLAASSYLFEIVFLLQLLFYCIAATGWMIERFGAKIGIFALPHYFLIANAASVLGFYKFLKGERYATWEPIRDTAESKSASS